jgi:hypothetical protein
VTRPLRSVKPAISYTVPEAAEATGFGETLIRRAVSAGDLELHYFGAKSVLLGDDLAEWVRSLPTERVA